MTNIIPQRDIGREAVIHLYQDYLDLIKDPGPAEEKLLLYKALLDSIKDDIDSVEDNKYKEATIYLLQHLYHCVDKNICNLLVK